MLENLLIGAFVAGVVLVEPSTAHQARPFAVRRKSYRNWRTSASSTLSKVAIRGGWTDFAETQTSTTTTASDDVHVATPSIEPLDPSLASTNNKHQSSFHVTKRDGQRELFNVTKLDHRLALVAQDLSEQKFLDLVALRDSIVRGLYDGVTSDELDVLIAETSAALSTQHVVYAQLAAQIVLTRNRKTTPPTFSQAMLLLAQEDGADGTQSYLHPDLIDLVRRRGREIDARIAIGGAMDMTYFGFKTLERAYLLRIGQERNSGVVVERPEYLMMRVALGVHCCSPLDVNRSAMPYDTASEDERLEQAFETYDLMSRGFFTHASPTLFNAGTVHPQLSSCFLVQMRDDSIAGIYETLQQTALISKNAGGIGLSVHNIRARGTRIRGTRGVSNGLVPMLRVFDVTSRYVDQGGGKRPGAFAIYIEPWHADIFDVLNLKKNHGKEENRARDLFYGLWIPDLFMQRVEQDGVWSLMCPNQCAGLSEHYGRAFDDLYEMYEREGRFVRQVRARDLWSAILESQIETGTPYMLYKGKQTCFHPSNGCLCSC
jgi:Ribonucleotide reductase, barrel domain/Ribonucleotide reductase, all-alpha domain/ATP cone domain